MNLQEMIKVVKRDVATEQYGCAFEHAKGEHAVLQEYPTVAGLLAAVLDRRRGYAKKEVLARTLVQLQRDRPHPLWSGLLIVAFYPMLARLSAGRKEDGLSREERDQMAMAAFLETVRTENLVEDKSYVQLKRATRRRLFTVCRHERKEIEAPRLVEDAHMAMENSGELVPGLLECWSNCKSQRGPTVPSVEDQVAMIRLLLAHAPANLDGDKIELLITTLVRGETLRSYVRRVHASLPAEERERTYQRLKRRHARAMIQMRQAMRKRYSDAGHAQEMLSRQGSSSALSLCGTGSALGAGLGPGERHESNEATPGPYPGATRCNL